MLSVLPFLLHVLSEVRAIKPALLAARTLYVIEIISTAADRRNTESIIMKVRESITVS